MGTSLLRPSRSLKSTSKILLKRRITVTWLLKVAHPKITTKVKNGKPIVELHIITGKGLHSARKKSVLKPAIQEMCQHLNLSYDNTEGGVLVRIPL